MSEQDIKDLMLAIDVLISERLRYSNDTCEQFNERRERITDQILMVMKNNRKLNGEASNE